MRQHDRALTEPPAGGHLDALDGVRGLAILMVVSTHAFASNAGAHGGLARGLGVAFGYGIFGVDLFFVLSGFLITGILVDTIEDEGFFRKFYARRALRIFPLYYGVLLVLFLLTPTLGLRWHGMGWLLVGYLQNLRPTAIGTFSPGWSLGLNHFWSLAVEEQFYLVWPAVVFWVKDRRRLLWVTLAISVGALVLRLCLVAVGVGAQAIHVTTITRADTLLLGGALALIYRSSAWNRLVRFAPSAAILAALAIVVSIVRLPPEFVVHPAAGIGRYWVDGLRYTVLALSGCGLIGWALTPGSACARLFASGWLRFFGRYSYGIYVLHMIPLSWLLRVQRAAIGEATQSKMAGVAGAALGLLVLATAAAMLSYHLYEAPILRLKRFFAYGLARPRFAPLPNNEVKGSEPVSHPLVDSKSYTSRVLSR